MASLMVTQLGSTEMDSTSWLPNFKALATSPKPHDSHHQRANSVTWLVVFSAMVLDHDSFTDRLYSQ